MNGPAELRYAVLTTVWPLAGWEARSLEALAEVEGARPVVTVYARPPKLRIHRGGLLWRLTRPIRGLAERDPLASYAVWPDVFDRLPRLDCTLEPMGRYGARFAAHDVEALARLRLDFVLAFLGYHVLRGGILTVPRYGVWSYHHGDPEAYRGAPPGLWEVHDGAPTSGAMLQRLTEALDAGVVLRCERVATIQTSWRRNRSQLYARSVPWAAETCRRILAGDTAFLSAPPVASRAPVRTAPGDLQAARLLWMQWRNRWRARRAVR
jgi:hypothetical protein